jgi:voltage-gated potassium channel
MLGLLVVDFTVNLSPSWVERLGQVETGIWAIFAAAFFLELLIAPSRWAYLRANWLTALAVLLPALRAVRILRAARALRGLSLMRLLTTLNRGSRALGHVVRQGQLGYVAALTGVVVIVAAAGGFYFEQGEPGATITSVGEALWWAATLVTTINAAPAAVTLEGRAIGLLLRLFGLGLSGYITALIAAHWLGAAPSDTGISPREWAALRADVARLRELADAPGSGAGEPANRGESV